MNEITRIHLGRQPFTAAVDAHKALKAYIAAIHNYVKDQDVMDEVELRMAELLTERGISGDKVILPQDIEYLKQQLGDPQDFSDNNAEADGKESDTQDTPPQEQPAANKRLFRDTDHGMLAGVSAGLAAYFGVDAAFIRILFVIAVLTGGWGLVLYVALWLIIPPAKTGSDRLRMRGESVTLSNLKEVVDRADAKGVARRAGHTIAPIINGIFRFVFRLIGLAFIIGGLAILFGLVALAVYMATHNGQLFQEAIFPVGAGERWLAALVMLLIGLIGVFGITVGQAINKRRWPMRGWVTGVIAGLFFFGLAAAGALAADSVPKVRDRVLDRTHTTVRTVAPFQTVKVTGGNVGYQWQQADKHEVIFRYFDNPDISKIKTTVSGTELQIDGTGFDDQRRCSMLCIFPDYNLEVVVKGPQPQPPIGDEPIDEL